MITKRAISICVLEILKEYSDADHILMMRDLRTKMKSFYGLDVDRRTLYGAIELLITLGYDISSYADNGIGYYLIERPLEVSELRLLMDAVYSNQAISRNQTEKLIKKLQLLLSTYYRQVYKNLTIVRTDKKTNNPEVFINIEILDEAIQEEKKAQFIYLEYDYDKSLKPRRSEMYTVNPYQMIVTNGRYYLICKMTPVSQISFYRIDLMRNVKISNFKIDAPLTETEVQSAMEKTIYAWYGEPETITMRCASYILGDIIDKFGRSVLIEKETEEFFLATFKSAPQGVLFWALQYLPHVEILRPEWLRDKVIASIKKNPYVDFEA